MSRGQDSREQGLSLGCQFVTWSELVSSGAILPESAPGDVFGIFLEEFEFKS